MTLSTCLWMNGTAKEAAELYLSVFEKSEITNQNPMVVGFRLGGIPFMALNGGSMFKINSSISFMVSCESANEVEEKYNVLIQGGSVLMPLGTYPWSEKYGWCQDKYGVNWQLFLGQIESKISPCFMFGGAQNGKATEAMNFYTSLFKNSEILSLNKYEENDQDITGNIKHGRFNLMGNAIIAMDSSMPNTPTFNEGISLVVNCETQEEIDFLWDSLTKDGKESQCGWLKDKYGVSWQIVPNILAKLLSDPEKAPAVTKAFMQMKKFDIEKLLTA